MTTLYYNKKSLDLCGNLVYLDYSDIYKNIITDNYDEIIKKYIGEYKTDEIINEGDFVLVERDYSDWKLVRLSRYDVESEKLSGNPKDNNLRYTVICKRYSDIGCL